MAAMKEESELNDLKQTTIHLLDDFKNISSEGKEYWLARDLQKLLDYIDWRDFRNVTDKAENACELVGAIKENHFVHLHKMVSIGSKAERPIDDIALSRYACYLIAMNGDPSKPVIAAAQTYFAVQTRKQELAEQRGDLESRLDMRDRVKMSNKELNSTAKNVGVQNYALFHDAGYRGLYGDLGLTQIKNKKGIDLKEDLLDRIGHQELAANYFRITQAEEKLNRDQVSGDQQARQVHKDVARAIRNTIKKLDGIMPENLSAEPSLKRIGKAKNQAKELPPPIKG